MLNSTDIFADRLRGDDEHQTLITTLKGEEEFLLDCNGIIISTNLELVNVCGYEEWEVIGQAFSIFYTSAHKSRWEDDLHRSKLNGSVTISGPFLKKKSTIFWAKIKILYLGETNRKPRYRVTLQDTTYRKLSADRIKTVREEYLALLNNPFVGIFKFRFEDLKILMCNTKAREIADGFEEELKFDELFFDRNIFKSFLNILKKDRHIHGFRIQLKSTLKSKWVLISAKVSSDNGFAEGFLLDVSDQENQMIELKRVNRELDSFTYHASHALRAPMTTMMGLINLGLAETDTLAMHSYLKMLSEQVHRMDTLLKNLILINSKDADISYQSFFFKNEIKSILLEINLPSSPCTLDVDVDQQSDFITGVREMGTILRNLISNALSYFKLGAVNPIVRLKVKVRETHVAIKIQDNGIGIEDDYRNRIFDMFFRATDRSTGSGLGLYVVKSMVEKLNGKISFETTLSHGTTFLVTIPNIATKNSKAGNASLANLKYQLEKFDNDYPITA
jgi:signal transduction histidine kinase